MAVWLSDNGVTHINEVDLRQARLVLGWVTVRGYTIWVFNPSPRPTQPGHSSVGRRNVYTGNGLGTGHPGLLSLAIPPWVGSMCTLVMVSATAREETVSSA